jgi:RimJ/RimL family protein N-acetyltransferase
VFDETGRVSIVPVEERFIEGLAAVLDAVARERRWLLLLEAPPVDACREFVNRVVEGGGVQMLAVDEEGTVVGWCDVVRMTRPPLRHCGTLGMGLRSDYRGRGLGTQLLTATIAAARGTGIDRIELDVFASNAAAIALYIRHGFAVEGVKRRAVCIDGAYEDLLFMALLESDSGFTI